MRPALLVAVLALLAAGLTALLARSWLDKAATRPAAQAPTAEVLVMARDLPAGTVLKADDLRYDSWPLSNLSPRLIRRTGAEDNRAAYAGRIARRQMLAGEPLAEEALAKHDDSGLMASLLAPGMRAISIPVTGPSAVSGFITPGDLVDVVVAADLARTLEGKTVAPTNRLLRYAAETVLRDIKVLAIDQQVARAPDGGAVQGKTATVAVTPKQAEILTVAGLLGPLELVLRGKSEDPQKPAQGYSGDIETSLALRSLAGSHGGGGAAGPSVEINRGGAVSVEGFSR
jgi:pilus assembly protein CpaB